MTVGGDHPHLVALHHQQQAVEVVADVLLRHGVLHQRQQTFELFLGQVDFGLRAIGTGHAREIFGGQSLQVETAFTGLELEAAIFVIQADFGRFGQRTQDVLQLARSDGERRLVAAAGAGGSADLDFDIGGKQCQAITIFFHQHVGKNRQRVTFFNDAANGLQWRQKLIAGAFE